MSQARLKCWNARGVGPCGLECVSVRANQGASGRALPIAEFNDAPILDISKSNFGCAHDVAGGQGAINDSERDITLYRKSAMQAALVSKLPLVVVNDAFGVVFCVCGPHGCIRFTGGWYMETKHGQCRQLVVSFGVRGLNVVLQVNVAQVAIIVCR